MNYYMNIKVELRRQLRLVQSKREDLEHKVAATHRKSYHVMDKFFKVKCDLISTLASKEKSIQELGVHMEELTKVWLRISWMLYPIKLPT